MKTKTQMIAVLLTVLSTVAFATGDEKDKLNAKASVEVKMEGAQIFNLIYKGENSEKVDIRIYDESKRLVFSESIKKYDAFSRPYNLSNLPEGIYTVVVKDANGTINKSVENYTSRSSENVNFGLIRFNEVAQDKYKLTIINNGVANAEVKIYDKTGDLLYVKNEKLTGNFALLYNLSLVNAKTVKVRLNGAENTFALN
ncbi:MAG: T9SS type A sorting domain-containing protein [Fulvivirga sp.]